MTERERIEKLLEEEQGTMERQKLFKQLRKLERERDTAEVPTEGPPPFRREPVTAR